MLPKERFAWIWSTALFAVFAIYFSVDHWQGIEAAPTFGMRIGTLAVALGSLGVIALAAHFLTRSRPEADERDRFIAARSSSAAYGVLMAGMILVGVVMPFHRNGWELVHAALACIALAEIVHHGLIALSYRRGWRA